MISFTALLCLKVEAKEVKSNYFGEDLSEISPLDNPLCLLKQNIS
jgi:hypothetical protein